MFCLCVCVFFCCKPFSMITCMFFDGILTRFVLSNVCPSLFSCPPLPSGYPSPPRRPPLAGLWRPYPAPQQVHPDQEPIPAAGETPDPALLRHVSEVCGSFFQVFDAWHCFCKKLPACRRSEESCLELAQTPIAMKT